MTQPIITVVGSFAVGMTLRTSRMPIFGETLLGTDFDMGPGGKGSNQAVGTARLGAKSSFAGIVGQDKLAEIARDLYAAEGIDTTYLHTTDRLATGVGFIILNERGENGIILDMSANKLMDAAFVDGVAAQIARSSIVMAVLEIPVEAAARAMALGRQHGVTTLLNPAPAAPLPEAAFPNIDYLTPNETELRVLMGLAPDDPTPTPELARQLQARGVGTIIVTQGERGALILKDGAITEVPSVPVEVIDTTGAGDSFNSGLAVALAEGRSLIEAVQFGICTGALACTALGVIPSLPSRAQADHLYKTHFGA